MVSAKGSDGCGFGDGGRDGDGLGSWRWHAKTAFTVGAAMDVAWMLC
jgi:hypothetical protein